MRSFKSHRSPSPACQNTWKSQLLGDAECLSYPFPPRTPPPAPSHGLGIIPRSKVPLVKSRSVQWVLTLSDPFPGPTARSGVWFGEQPRRVAAWTCGEDPFPFNTLQLWPLRERSAVPSHGRCALPPSPHCPGP